MLPPFCIKTYASYFIEFSFDGRSEEELAGGSDEITTKGKISSKKVRPISRIKRLKRSKSFHFMEESDEEKQDYAETISEDRESIPQYSSAEREVHESSGASRENVNREGEADSEGRQDNSDVEGSPAEMKKSLVEPSSNPNDIRIDIKIADISDDVPLVNNSTFLELLCFPSTYSIGLSSKLI